MRALFGGRVLRKFAGGCDCETTYCPCADLEPATPADAELVTSLMSVVPDRNNGAHMPVIDIDLPCRLVESATPGHYHLYIDHEVSWPAYLKMLEAMTDAGIVQPGYLRGTERRGYSAVRVPWRPKGVS